MKNMNNWSSAQRNIQILPALPNKLFMTCFCLETGGVAQIQLLLWSSSNVLM